MWVIYNDDNYDTFTSCTDQILNKYPLSDFDLDDFRLGDVIRDISPIENEK